MDKLKTLGSETFIRNNHFRSRHKKPILSRFLISMAKTRSAENPVPEENSDGLEIISIGSLYKGPWDKKYWSSSRGKDRYPYPVGYQATRAHNGTTYKMEIYEGVSGPRFVITSADGYSCSGKTPDIAWKEFQKRGCPRMKIWHGKRLSSKMDGLELFGFKNPCVQRLLWELVADLNGKAEQSLNICNGISRIEHDGCCQNVGTYSDLLLCLGRPHVTGKRSRRCENKNVELHGETLLKRSRPQESTCSSIASNIKTKSINLGSPLTHNVSEESEAHNHTSALAPMHIMSSVRESASCFSLKNGLPLNHIDTSDYQKGRALHAERTGVVVDSTNGIATEIADSISKEEEHLHRSQDAELKTSNFLVAEEDKKLVASISKVSGGCINIDICAPNTIDYAQENISDSMPSTMDKNAYTKRAYEITSGDVFSIEHQEVLKSNSNPSMEKSDFVSGSEDVPKSMMTVLLPQAIPLLKKDSTNRKLTIEPSGMLPSIMNSSEEDNKIGSLLEASSSVATDNAYVEREKKMHMPNTDLSSIVPSSKHAKFVIADSFEPSQCEEREENMRVPNTDLSSIVPSSELAKFVIADSFEPSQCEDHKSDHPVLYFDIAETGKVSFNEETHSPSSQERHDHGTFSNESSKCHADIENKLCHVSELDSEELPRDGDVCIPDSVLDHMSPLNRIISESSYDTCTDLEENSLQVGLNTVEKDLKAAYDFTGDTGNVPEKRTEDEIVSKTGNDKAMIMPSVQVPNIVYTRRNIRNAAPPRENCPLAERAKSDKYEEHVTSEMHIAKSTSPPSETIQSDNELCKPDLLGNQVMDKGQSDDLQIDNSITSSHLKQSPTASENKPSLCATKENILCPDDLSALHVEKPQIRSDVLGGYRNFAELDNPKSCWNPNPSSSENNCFSKEEQVISEPNRHGNDDFNNNLSSTIKFVGCYTLPMTVSSLLLSRRENEILIYVFCGPVVDRERTLFTYKVEVNESNVGCPSFIAYTSLLLPDPKHNFIRETVVEKCGVQLTPDGQCIVLLGSIKAPNCRERKFCCYCSSCMSVCTEENALKIVQVERGYVSVVATLKTVEVVHCILVCEPNQLVSVGESGRLQIWIMNSTWREKIEDFIMPADDTNSPGIVELKRVPKCTNLVIAYNGVGEFSLWDISKRNCVSRVSASTNPINQFLPVSVLNCQTNSLGFNYTSVEEHVDYLLNATSLWFSEHQETCSFPPSEEGDIAMWILVSTASDVEFQHKCISSHCQINTARSWRLALLVKNNMILGSPFDIRTTAIGVLSGHGIISTCDGLVYIWELSRGSKVGTLHHFKDDTVTCIATDDSRGGVLGVAGGEGRLLVYLLHNPLDAQ